MNQSNFKPAEYYRHLREDKAAADKPPESPQKERIGKSGVIIRVPRGTAQGRAQAAEKAMGDIMGMLKL